MRRTPAKKGVHHGNSEEKRGVAEIFGPIKINRGTPSLQAKHKNLTANPLVRLYHPGLMV